MPERLFVSYTRADERWAKWVAWHLERAGHSVKIQAWDFGVGSNFVLKMDEAIRTSERVVLILSPEYFRSDFTQPEWAAYFAQDSRSSARKIIPLRVAEFKVEGLLGPVVYADLFNRSEEEALETLLSAIAGPSRPTEAPAFPGGATTAKSPDFPGNDIFLVPTRNPHFSGREELLADLVTSLENGGRAGLSQAMTGLGGVGKTETAREFAYRNRGRYRAVLWATADTVTALDTAYREIATALGSPFALDVPSEEVRNAVVRWLKGHDKWLLILDNVEQAVFAEVAAGLPRNLRGHLLVTSRARELTPLGISHPREVETWTPDQGADFLLARTNRTTGRDIALEISAALDGLPLALEQAGAYLVATRASFRDYLDELAVTTLALIEKGVPQTGYEFTVAKTWLPNIRQVAATSPASAELLKFAALLAPDRIPFELILRGASALGPEISAAIGDGRRPLAVSDLLAPLFEYSLVTIDGEDHTFSIHRLVQLVQRHALEIDLEEWREAALKVIHSAWPLGKFENWPTCARQFPHARHLVNTAVPSRALFTLLHELGFYLLTLCDYIKAEEVLRECYELSKSLEGIDTALVMDCTNSLGLLFKSTGRYAEAESLYLEALSLRQRRLGPDHPDTLGSANNLAMLYQATGRHIEAENLQISTLSSRRRILGLEHPDTLTSTNNLAALYSSMGRYSEAESLYLMALSSLREVLGDDHPNTLTSTNNLANLYESMNRIAEAEVLYRETFQSLVLVCGEDHLYTLTIANNYANLLYKSNRASDAQEIILGCLPAARRLAVGVPIRSRILELAGVLGL